MCEAGPAPDLITYNTLIKGMPVLSSPMLRPCPVRRASAHRVGGCRYRVLQLLADGSGAAAVLRPAQAAPQAQPDHLRGDHRRLWAARGVRARLAVGDHDGRARLRAQRAGVHQPDQLRGEAPRRARGEARAGGLRANVCQGRAAQRADLWRAAQGLPTILVGRPCEGRVRAHAAQRGPAQRRVPHPPAGGLQERRSALPSHLPRADAWHGVQARRQQGLYPLRGPRSVLQGRTDPAQAPGSLMLNNAWHARLVCRTSARRRWRGI
eukprot:scaffold2449_cov340-Prasinococcus_capsulatus_cf.AAC.3